MDRAYFFSGQLVENDDLNYISDSLGAALKSRTIDFFSKGVVNTNATYVVNDKNNTILIKPFVAYTAKGERVVVSRDLHGLAMDLSNPAELRLTTQGSLSDYDFGWQEKTYDIYINYIEKAARPRPHKTENEFYPTRIASGFEFYALDAEVYGDSTSFINNESTVVQKSDLVRLCRLTYDGVQLYISTDNYTDYTTIDARKLITDGNYVRPSVYAPTTIGNKENLQSHLYCIGSGTPTPTNPHGLTAADIGIKGQTVQEHETSMHVPGIYGEYARSSTTSALFTAINSVSALNVMDCLRISNLLAPERIHYNGKWYESYKYDTQEVYIHFNGNSDSRYNPIAGKYRIGIDLDTLGIISCKVVASTAEYDSGTYRLIIAKEADDYEAGSVNYIEYIEVLSENDYNKRKVFNISEVEFSTTKSRSVAVAAFATSISISNFTEKTDLRVFGSTSPTQLATIKKIIDGEVKDVLEIPFVLEVKGVKVTEETSDSSGTNAIALPPDYIRGFGITYVNDTTVTVNPGICRDSTNFINISLKTQITKSITTAWAPGNNTGGLQNSSGQLSGFGGTGLHVFVISTYDGILDVAFDTDIQAAGITSSSAPTKKYAYIRRVGTIYLSHHLDDSQETGTRRNMDRFVTTTDGNGIWFIYTNQQELEKDSYDATTRVFRYTNVPTGSVFLGKFCYRAIFDGVGEHIAITRPFSGSSNNITRLSGFGEFELFETNNSFKAVSMENSGGSLSERALTFEVDASGSQYYSKIHCIGYYDSRSI